ncbi:MAG: tRNA pseudouridine(38-40) synthase TruA, partial [Flavobacteriaceae bacterium]|nr:tRNA pseudouridine(38-40) synthase TruA [Flavobacteriaceae bacterium]
NRAAKILFEYTDFTSFSKLHADNKTNDCAIFRANWEQNEDELVFTVSANRFLRNMVRAIVGTLIDVGRGKLSIEEFREIIEKKDRKFASASAPAQGLILVNVDYPQHIYERQTGR